MSEARPKVAAETFSEDEVKFLEAIKRTQAEINPPAGVNLDLRAIAEQAFASYLEGLDAEKILEKGPKERVDWNVVNEPQLGLTAVLAKATDSFNTTLSELLQSEPAQRKEFGRDLMWTVIPTTVLLFLGGIYLFLRWKVDLPYGPLATAVLILTFALAGGITARFLYNPTAFSKHIASLRHSGGALVGGLVVASLAGGYALQQKVKWQHAMIDDASRALAEVGFSSVGQKDTASLKAKMLMELDNSQNYLVEAEKNGDGLKFVARPTDVAAKIVLNIDPKRAAVYSTNSNQPDYQILTGRLNYISDSFVEIKPNDSTYTQPLKINLEAGTSERAKLANWIPSDETNIEKLKGEEVKVLFESKGSRALKMSLLQSGTESVIYNSALSNVTLKSNTVAN